MINKRIHKVGLSHVGKFEKKISIEAMDGKRTHSLYVYVPFFHSSPQLLVLYLINKSLNRFFMI